MDFPGRVSALVFTGGCNFRCDYCYNANILDIKNIKDPISEKDFFIFLEDRVNKLSGICITGGEPTIHSDLVPFIKRIKDMGFDVKLDTNGSNLTALKELLDQNLLDYVAMDIKGPPNRYQEITNSKMPYERVKESIDLLLNSGIDYEFRTTVVEGQLNKEDFELIGPELKGAKRYFLQKFEPINTQNPKFLSRESYSDEAMLGFKNILDAYVSECLVR